MALQVCNHQPRLYMEVDWPRSKHFKDEFRGQDLRTEFVDELCRRILPTNLEDEFSDNFWRRIWGRIIRTRIFRRSVGFMRSKSPKQKKIHAQTHAGFRVFPGWGWKGICRRNSPKNRLRLCLPCKLVIFSEVILETFQKDPSKEA